MDSNPRILIWNIMGAERLELDMVLRQLGLPAPKAIEADQGDLYVHELLFEDRHGDKRLEAAEKVVLFFNITADDIRTVMRETREKGLEKPIFAIVTEHSIGWRFSHLLEHLVAEREHVMEMERQRPEGETADTGR